MLKLLKMKIIFFFFIERFNIAKSYEKFRDLILNIIIKKISKTKKLNRKIKKTKTKNIKQTRF